MVHTTGSAVGDVFARRSFKILSIATIKSNSRIFPVVLAIGLLLTAVIGASAQDTVTGAFEGRVSNSRTNDPIAAVAVSITSLQTGTVYTLTTDSKGRFYQGLLPPGQYDILVSVPGFRPQRLLREIKVSITGDIVPVPVSLEPETSPSTPPAAPAPADDIRVDINTVDARRGGSTKVDEITKIPIAATTLTRSFDELALLQPGVAPPPQTIGDTAGPGVGPGVGSAGQFAVNGMRSRANNFTVDGSDNNDEDIGVRRQGFVSLIPQPVESIQEFQITSLLAPAQFGRNVGAQVNAVSRGGGNKPTGALYGFFNSSALNARSVFDTTDRPEAFQLHSAAGQAVLLDGQPITVRNDSDGEDSFTFGHGGGVIGGAIKPNKSFYFVSAEIQKINASREKSFAVPTVDERGAFGTGARGISRNFFNGQDTRLTPVSQRSAAIFSLYPFPNNPDGVYGANTFTQVLPDSARGTILSGRLDQNFGSSSRRQTFTARYNFTDDRRDIPTVNDAIYSGVEAKVRTHNLSLFLNSELSDSSSASRLFNQVRVSIGRTRLAFSELAGAGSPLRSRKFPDMPFLLNAPYVFNTTLPPSNGVPNTGNVTYAGTFNPPNVHPTTEDVPGVGSIGQVVMAGFSSLGVDVYNFPQTRKNNTLQAADELTWRREAHTFVVGGDVRRTDLDSDLPRLARPLFTFNGSPRLVPRGTSGCSNGGIGNFCFLPPNDPTRVIRPQDLAALGAASSSLLTFNVDRPDSKVHLRYYQFNFYGQDTWRIANNFTLSYGLRYEFNTPVREVDGLIEQTFTDPRLALVPGLQRFIDGRTKLYEPDRNNFAPRIGFAWSPELFGEHRTSVFRAGYGLYYDQILGAVVNQSRNVFPTFLTLNLGGVETIGAAPTRLALENPAVRDFGFNVPLAVPGTLNMFNSGQIDLATLLASFGTAYPNAISATLPARRLDMPMAHHYSFVFEQQLNRRLTASVGFVGTLGRMLLRFTTPNLGAGSTIVPTSMDPPSGIGAPVVYGVVFPLSDKRLEPTVGAINQFETTAESNYRSLQTELRGRFSMRLSFLASYVLSKAEDDVSDVFDLAGAYALPQNSITFAGERAPANFDVRHRFTYSAIYSFTKEGHGALGWLADNLQIGTTGKLRSGQPFTVNSIVDVNLDGNLTDRLDSTDGITITGDPRQPLRLDTDPFSLLAPFGQDGRIPRNSFRAGRVIELDVSIIKPISLGSGRLDLRADIFNFINRANYGIPVRLLEAPGFGKATSTVTPSRRVQFSLKYEF